MPQPSGFKGRNDKTMGLYVLPYNNHNGVWYKLKCRYCGNETKEQDDFDLCPDCHEYVESIVEETVRQKNTSKPERLCPWCGCKLERRYAFLKCTNCEYKQFCGAQYIEW